MSKIVKNAVNMDSEKNFATDGTITESLPFESRGGERIAMTDEYIDFILQRRLKQIEQRNQTTNNN